MTEPIELKRKRLLYRSKYCGNKEMDLILGTFAERNLETLSELQLNRYDELIRTPDLDLYDWIIGRKPVPPEFDHDVMKLLQAFKFYVERSESH
jgi:antitoxin CptB